MVRLHAVEGALLTPPFAPTLPDFGASAAVVPWEVRPGFAAWFQTAWRVLTAPRVTLRATPAARLGRPFLFWLPSTLVAFVASLLWPLVLHGLTWLADPEQAELEALSLGLTTTLRLAFVLVGLPAMAAAVHGLLVALASPHRPRRGYECTFRALAYTSGSAAPLVLVPCTGEMLAVGWGVAIAVPALMAVHETGPVVTAVAFLLPLVFCCGLLVATLVAAGGLGIPT